MEKFKDFISEKESVKDTIGNNTLVLAKKDGKTFTVSKCGIPEFDILDYDS